MVIVGRSPPESLIREARDSGFPWSFTGWVADTRPFVWDSAAFVVPLRVAGGTRLKVWEGMALGCPVVSTSIGVEGLPVQCGEHFLGGDDPIELAAKLVQLVGDPLLRVRLAARARSYVEENFSYKVAANQFEDICLRTLARDV
jgi:glycosyltransferase involved in cell wall biosynthesis